MAFVFTKARSGSEPYESIDFENLLSHALERREFVIHYLSPLQNRADP